MNFIGCTDEVTNKGIVDVLAPLGRSASDDVNLELDDVAFLTKDALNCLSAAILDPEVALPGPIALAC